MFTNAITVFLERNIPDRVGKMLAVGSPIDFPFIAHLNSFTDKLVYLKISNEQMTYPAKNYLIQNSSIQIVEGDLGFANFGNESFDLVFIYEVLYRTDNPERLIQNYLPLLKPGGSMVAIEANWK